MEQILCFGQCPSQLFTKPHPARKMRREVVVSVFDNPSLFQIAGEQELKLTAKQIFVSGDRLAAVGSTGQFRMFRFVAPSGGGHASFNSLHTSLATPLCAVSMSDKLIASGRERSRFFVDVESKTMLSYCYWDSSIRLCALQASITMLQGVRMHKAAVTCLAPTESLQAAVSGSLDGTLMVWKVERQRGRPLQLHPKPRFVLRGHTDAVSCLAVSERLDVVISGSAGGAVAVHTLHSGRFVRSFFDDPRAGYLAGGVDFILVSSLAKVVVFSHATQWLVLYDINGLQLAATQLAGVKLPVRDMAVTADGKHLLVAGRQLHVYTAHDLELVKSFDVSEEIYSLSFILDERFLLLGLQSGRLITCCMSAAAP